MAMMMVVIARGGGEDGRMARERCGEGARWRWMRLGVVAPSISAPRACVRGCRGSSTGTGAEKKISPSTVDGKLGQAVDSLHEEALALNLGDVEEGEALGAELTGDETGEVTDQRGDLTEGTDGMVRISCRH